MKKLIFTLAGLVAFVSIIAQPVSDNAVIPVSVTLNSILRLNVVSGGNIEFVVNTLDQYENGIANTTRYTTTFTVASSIDFDVDLYAQDAQLIGSGSSSNTMPLNNIGYVLEATGTGTVSATGNYSLAGGNVSPSALQALSSSITEIISSIPVPAGAGGAGDVNQNRFEIQWELGTQTPPLNSTSLLRQSLTADRYTTNVFLVLRPRE
ncbi:MAG TPA: hypothetical protein PK990_00140 [Salinivirgaceae bacterium]|nr:hypothetical protein [Salinivirgaceae bacterium]